MAQKKIMLKELLKEYQEAVEANIKASQDEAESKDRKRKAHYKLLRASEALRAGTKELLEETFILN